MSQSPDDTDNTTIVSDTKEVIEMETNHDEKLVNSVCRLGISEMEDFTYYDTLNSSPEDVKTMTEYAASYHDEIVRDLKDLSKNSLSQMRINNGTYNYIRYIQSNHGMFDGVIVFKSQTALGVKYMKIARQLQDIPLYPKTLQYAKKLYQETKVNQVFQVWDKESWKIARVNYISNIIIVLKYGVKLTTRNLPQFIQDVISGHIKKHYI